MYKSMNKKLISERTGKNTVALVGFAPTSRDLAPYDDPATEIWAMNESYKYDFVKRATRWFQMHSESNFSRPDNPNDPDHYEWLRTQKEYPILMQHKYRQIPMAVAYPLEDVIRLTGLRYFTSTFAYMIGLAILEKFERIELYGFEMASNTEYHYQRACAEFWMGYAIGLGIDVALPENCNLLSGQLYGYELMSVGFRQQLEIRDRNLTLQAREESHQFLRLDGAATFLKDLIEQEKTLPSLDDLKKIRTEIVAARNEQQAITNATEGQKKEIANIIKLYDSYPFEIDRGDGDYEQKLSQE